MLSSSELYVLDVLLMSDVLDIFIFPVAFPSLPRRIKDF
jgi:hypothetical protein